MNLTRENNPNTLDLTTEFQQPSYKNDPLWAVAQQVAEDDLTKEIINSCLYVRNLHKKVFQTFEPSEPLIKTWESEKNNTHDLSGGGVMTVFRGEKLEKSAVNISVVKGPHYPAVDETHRGKPFVAIGVSLISHPKNPNAPIMHMNVRCLRVLNQDRSWTTWIGGGADLTPMVQFEEDTFQFHQAMESACHSNPCINNYEKYKKWADEYYFISHRKEARGIGGIFFDYVPFETIADLRALIQVGSESARVYNDILGRRIEMPFDEVLKEKHLYWRGRYAEFNLIYDRGTRFGLMSGGNYEAIFCSLPPLLRW